LLRGLSLEWNTAARVAIARAPAVLNRERVARCEYGRPSASAHTGESLTQIDGARGDIRRVAGGGGSNSAFTSGGPRPGKRSGHGPPRNDVGGRVSARKGESASIWTSALPGRAGIHPVSRLPVWRVALPNRRSQGVHVTSKQVSNLSAPRPPTAPPSCPLRGSRQGPRDQARGGPPFTRGGLAAGPDNAEPLPRKATSAVPPFGTSPPRQRPDRAARDRATPGRLK